MKKGTLERLTDWGKFSKPGSLNRSRTIATFVGIALIALALWRIPNRWRSDITPASQTRFLMGTSVTIKVFAASPARAADLMGRAFDEMARIERLTSVSALWDSTSEIRAINAAAGSLWVPVSPDVAYLLESATEYSICTQGRFDVTIGPISRLWGFPSGHPRVPSAQEIRQHLPLVGYEGLHLKEGKAKLDRAGMALDLGSIAKGHAVDRAVDLLKREGVDAALVEAGGDLRFFGRKPGNRPWGIAVQHPRLPETLIKVDSPYPSVATSGDYQRFLVVDGVRYHHILDPYTGYPATGLASVSVWTTSAMEADILATAVFVIGIEQGMALIEQRTDTEALIFFEKDGMLEYRASSGLKGKIHSGL